VLPEYLPTERFHFTLENGAEACFFEAQFQTADSGEKGGDFV